MIRTGLHIGNRFGSDSETYAGARDRELEARRRALRESTLLSSSQKINHRCILVRTHHRPSRQTTNHTQPGWCNDGI